MDNYERVNTADRDTVIYSDHHRKLEWCVKKKRALMVERPHS